MTRIINSDEIQSVVRAGGNQKTKRPFSQKKNALRNKSIMFALNPCSSPPASLPLESSSLTLRLSPFLDAKTAKRMALLTEARNSKKDNKLPGHKVALINAGAEFKATLLSA